MFDALWFSFFVAPIFCSLVGMEPVVVRVFPRLHCTYFRANDPDFDDDSAGKYG